VRWIGVNDKSIFEISFINAQMMVNKNIVAVDIANLEEKLAIVPVTSQAVDLAITFIVKHFLREETGEMAHSADYCATEHVIIIADLQCLIHNPVVFCLSHHIYMHHYRVMASFYFPIVADLRAEIV